MGNSHILHYIYIYIFSEKKIFFLKQGVKKGKKRLEAIKKKKNGHCALKVHLHVVMTTGPVSAIPHPALTYTIQTQEIEGQAIPFVSPLPPHLGMEGIFRKDELNSIGKLLIDQIAAKVDIICSQRQVLI